MQFREEIVAEIKKDFENRRQNRRPYELAWQLNMNFNMGNQYCSISPRGLEQEDKFFFWQEKQVYNHITPVVETRLSRLAKVRPRPHVRPFSSDEKDVQSAKLAEKILNSTFDKLEMDSLMSLATGWSEVCGTVFYKVGWQNEKGQIKGKPFKTGEVTVTVCPPFEIYPDSNVAQSLDDCASLIHARVYSTADVKKIWGVDVKGEDIAVFSIDNTTGIGGLGYNSTVPSVTHQTKKDVALVLERYTCPNATDKQGKLEIVCGEHLLYSGEMPFILGEDGQRKLPFIRQQAQSQTGCFWGASVIERLIPIQRAYNAVKNRKHEFINRLTMGVLEVEDGSVDIENLEDEGLSPGKILVYRQGANRPQLMASGSIPADFAYEERSLLEEFRVVSGVSEFATTSQTATASSGVALQLMLDQDDVRMQMSIENVKMAIKLLAKYLLKLYKQFATSPKLGKIANDEGKVEEFYFKGNQLSSDDVVFDTENDLTNSVASRRNMVSELVKMGILTDDNGKMTKSAKAKVLQMLGFGNWEDSLDLTKLHVKKAQNENFDIDKADLLSVDDHDIHIAEHTRYVISGQAKKREKVLAHIEQHKALKGLVQNEQIQNG